MLGDGIVSFGVAPSMVSRRYSKASPKMVFGSVTLLGDVHRGRRVVVLALLVAEMHVEALALDLLHAAELVDEVHVPGGAAELAVGRGLQPDLLLHGHDFADRLVLHRPQPIGVDAPGGVVLPGGQQLGRAQQAAHVVGAEWWLVAHGAPV